MNIVDFGQPVPSHMDLGYGASAMRGSDAAVPRPAGKAAPRPAPATTATRNVRGYRKCIGSKEKGVKEHRPFTTSGSEAARTTATRSSATIHKQHVPAIIVQLCVNLWMTRRDEAQLCPHLGLELATLAAPGSNERSVDTSQRAFGANSDFFALLRPAHFVNTARNADALCKVAQSSHNAHNVLRAIF